MIAVQQHHGIAMERDHGIQMMTFERVEAGCGLDKP
jgi:hypothetical protein